MEKVFSAAMGGSQDTLHELIAKAARNFQIISDCLETPQRATLFDHFMGDVLHDRWLVTAGSDSPAAGALVEGVGGLLRLSTGNSNVSLAADGIQICSFLNWQANQGDLIFQTKLKTSAITNLQLFAGFTDQRAGLEMPATLSAATYATVATDACGFLFDTAATVDTIRLVGVAGDTDAAHQDTGLAYVADTFMSLRIEVTRQGVAKFYINGAQIGSDMAGALRNNIPLTPVICARAAGDTVSKNIDVDYLGASMLTFA